VECTSQIPLFGGGGGCSSVLQQDSRSCIDLCSASLLLEPSVSRLELSQFLAMLPWWILRHA
jgi:hypothetical protein